MKGGGNAAQMMKMLSGEADMASMLSMLPQLMEGGNIKELLMKLAGSYLDTTPYGPLIQQYARQAMDSEQGAMFLNGVYDAFENFMKSDNGVRFVNLVPKLLVAKDTDSILLILGKEAEYNWGSFFDKIQNPDYKDAIMESAAEYIVTGYDFIQNPPKDSMLTKAPVILNGLLISQRLPALDMTRPVDSVTMIVNKGIKLFTTWKLDIAPYVKTVTNVLTQVYEKQAKGNKFSALSTREKKALLARIMEEELVGPLQTVWAVYSHVTSQAQCQEHLLCVINQREFRSIKPLRPNEGSATKLAITKAASLGISWTLAQGNKDEYWRLYKAVYEGAQGGDCMVLYPTIGKSCNLFSWQRKEFMSTQYDHVEL